MAAGAAKAVPIRSMAGTRGSDAWLEPEEALGMACAAADAAEEVDVWKAPANGLRAADDMDEDS